MATKIATKSGKQPATDNYCSPRWSGEILDCSMPLTFDQFSRCSYDCLYCFSFFQRGLKKYNQQLVDEKIYTELPPTHINVNKFKQIFVQGSKSEFAQYAQQRIAMQWGGLSDPFDGFEKRHGLGLELLQFLHPLKYPICFSTKGTWWVYDDRYARLFTDNNFWNVKVSIINLNNQKAAQMERGTPSPADRLRMMKDLYFIQGPGGAGVTLRLRPFIIGYSDVNDEYLELIAQAKENGASAVSTEFFCMEGRMTPESRERFDAMSEIMGIDIIDFYQRNSPLAAGYMRLNYKIKQPFINKMDKLCKQLGMRFYVSDAHHKDRCANGSCCGLPADWNYSRGQFTEALMIAKAKGEVSFEQLAAGMPECWKTINVVNANGLNVARGNPRDRARFRGYSIKDYIRYIWNSPNHPRSPYKYFFGVLYPDRLDSNNNVVYKYKPFDGQGYKMPAIKLPQRQATKLVQKPSVHFSWFLNEHCNCGCRLCTDNKLVWCSGVNCNQVETKQQFVDRTGYCG